MGQEDSSLNDPTSSTPPITEPDRYAESRTRQKQGILETHKINFHPYMNNYPKSRTNQGGDWYYPPGGGHRIRIICCGDCGYRAVRSDVLKHARKIHPSSTSALPPTNAMLKQSTLIHRCTECEYATNTKRDFNHHRVYHDEKSALQCPWCSFSSGTTSHLTSHMNYYHIKLDKKTLAVEKQPVERIDDAPFPTPKTREDWYVSPSGHRKRYIYCTECDYRTATRFNIINHEKMHRSFTFTVPTDSPKEMYPDKKITLLKCLECDFSTIKKHNMNGHKQCHQRNGKYKCQYCSFSSDFRTSMALHLKNGHHENLVPLGTPARIPMVPMEARLRKQFGIKECRVTLHNILSSFFKGNGELFSSNKADQTEDVKLEDGKIELLRIRMKTMEERARIAEEEVKEISSKKMNVLKRIEEIAGRRALIEYELRTQQCNLLQVGLSALEAEEEPSEMLMKPLEGKVKYLEGAMDVLDIEIEALQEDEKSLAQDVEEAKSSHLESFKCLKRYSLNWMVCC